MTKPDLIPDLPRHTDAETWLIENHPARAANYDWVARTALPLEKHRQL